MNDRKGYVQIQFFDLSLRWRIALAFAAVYLIWGSTYLAIRFALETIPPSLMGGVRFLIAGGALYGVLRWRGMRAPSQRQWRSTLIVGGLLLFGGNGVIVAEQYVPSSLAALIVAMVPLWMVLLSWWWGDRARPNAGTALGWGWGWWESS